MRVETLTEQLRWHRGNAASYSMGPLEIATLSDGEHGPSVSAEADRILMTHGADARPIAELERGHERFAALESDGRILRASRDPMGEVPLFFRIHGGSAWLATEIHPLLDVAPTLPDLEALSAEAAFVPYTMRTGWSGILRVPPGSTATFDASLRLSVSPYWRPTTLFATRSCSYAEAVQEFRERFEVAVARRRTSSTGVLLSGGLDSAAVAVAARDHQHPPRLITVAFPELPDTDETAYAQATADAVGVPLTVLEGRTDPWRPEEEPAVFGTTSTLLPTGSFDVGLKAFADKGVERVFDGHDGDGALGLYTDLYGGLAAHFEFRRLITLARRYGWRTVFPPALRESIPPRLRRLGRGRPAPAETDLWGRLRPFYRGRTGERIDAEMRWRPPARSWRRFQLLPLRPPITLVLEQMETEAARIGVDLLHPFTDRDLLSFLVSLPFSVKVDPERSKPLLRDGLADLLPEVVRSRPGKVFFNSVLDKRVDPAQCLSWIRESGVRLPDVDYGALFESTDADPANFHRLGWIRLTRAHLFAAAGGVGSPPVRTFSGLDRDSAAVSLAAAKDHDERKGG